LVSLGQIHNKAQVGGDHLLFGTLAHPQDPSFQLVKLAMRSLAASESATLIQADHGLHLSSQGELLFWGEQLMASDLTEKGTQRTGHRSKEHGHVQSLGVFWRILAKATRRFPNSLFFSYSTFLLDDWIFL
jgi:hypothetical protein